MNRRELLKKLAFAFALLGTMGGLVFSTAKIREYRYRPYLHDPIYLPSGAFLDRLSLGYEQIAADLVWLSTVQYYGDFRKGNHSLAYFSGLVELVTALDPHFVFAYVFGALVVAEDGGDFQAGIDMLKRGMAANPTSWLLPFEIGFLHYVHNVDYNVASRYFDVASRMPGAPESSKRFAAYVYSKAGERESSIRVWEQYREYTENPFLKDLATRYIEKLKAAEIRNVPHPNAP